MNPYAPSASLQRSVAGKIWKGIVAVLAAAAALFAAAFFLCSGRVDRERSRPALEKARGAESVSELDLALLPAFEKETLAPGKARYTARPTAAGLCGCAPALVDTVEVTYDSAGQVTEMSVSQSLGWAGRGK